MEIITKKFIVKTWEELTDEEKETQKRKYDEIIQETWADIMYNDFEMQLEDLQTKLKYIQFDNVYVDDNSQGYWIDSVKNVKCYIHNKTKSIYNFDFHISKFIENLSYVEIENTWESFENLKTMKGYKTLAKKLETDFEIFKNGINKIVKNYYDNIWYITDDFIDDFFEEMEFEFEYLEN